MPAKPLRTALGSFIIQKQYEYSDRELVEQIRENPYYRFFIGLPGYQDEEPFVPSLLVEFRKRLTDDILGDINEMIIDYNTPDDDPPAGGSGGDVENNAAPTENKDTLILDATCAPQQIAFPQDINLLNEARENLEILIDDNLQRIQLLQTPYVTPECQKGLPESCQMQKAYILAKRSEKPSRNSSSM